jgi:LPS-assembly lipoprotein
MRDHKACGAMNRRFPWPRLGLAAGLALLLGACLQPMNHLQVASTPSARVALSQVGLGRVEGYLGFILQTELEYLLSGDGRPGPRRYVLDVNLRESQTEAIVDSVTGRTETANLFVEAEYVLKDSQSGAILTKGRTFANAFYDRSSQFFSASRARRDAEERAAKLLAERLRSIVIVALSSARPVTPGDLPSLSPALQDADLDRLNELLGTD